MLIKLEDLRRDDERLVCAPVTYQGMLRVHAGNPEELSDLFGRRVVEARQALQSLCDSMLPSHPPLGLDFATVGFQSKQSPGQRVTSLPRTLQQAVTCRLRHPDHARQDDQGCTQDHALEDPLTARGTLEKRQHLLASRGCSLPDFQPTLQGHDAATPRSCTQSSGGQP